MDVNHHSLEIPFFDDLDPNRFIMGHAKNKSIPSISRCSNKLLSLWYIIELSLLVEIAQSGFFFCDKRGFLSKLWQHQLFDISCE